MLLPGPGERRGGSGDAETEAGRGLVEGGFEVAQFVVAVIKGELVDGVLGEPEAFGA
ncbi:hypothetical protein [Streptomyces cyaneofuscatus]